MPSASEWRALVAGVGARQGELARRLGYGYSQLSKYLNGHRTPPADFDARLRAVVREMAQEMADEERAAGDAKARALLEAAGITDDSSRTPVSA